MEEKPAPERPSLGRPTLGRPTLERKLTVRDLKIEADSDAESISVEGARADDDSAQSDSVHDDDGELEPGTSAHERFVAGLELLNIKEDIDTSDMEEFHRRLSDVTFSDRSYIMDLGRQQVTREETIRREAFENAHIWYGKALHRGMPESKELFTNIYNQLIEETRKNLAEFHKKQDEWLDQALDEYQKKLSAEELEKIQKSAPTDDDLKKQKLAKKISKIEKLMKKALKKEGEDSEAYRNYKKKLLEYRAQSDEHEDLETGPSKRKSKGKNGTGRTKSKDKTRTKSKDKKGRKTRSSSLRSRRSSRTLDLENDGQEKSVRTTRTTRTGAKKPKKKKERRGSKSLRSSRTIQPEDVDLKKVPSTTKTLKKKKVKPERRSSLPLPLENGTEPK